jgi:hypothetical protein
VEGFGTELSAEAVCAIFASADTAASVAKHSDVKTADNSVENANALINRNVFKINLSFV